MNTLITAIASGVLALIGGYIGARLTRQTEYEKWLRQERSKAFADFLRQLHDVRNKVVDAIYESKLSDLDRDIKISELFISLNAQENVVRLYLNPSDRQTFSDLLNELWAIQSTTVKQSLRLNRSKAIEAELQEIFESTLHDKKSKRRDSKAQTTGKPQTQPAKTL